MESACHRTGENGNVKLRRMLCRAAVRGPRILPPRRRMVMTLLSVLLEMGPQVPTLEANDGGDMAG